MRLQVRLEPAVEIVRVGMLGIVGTEEMILEPTRFGASGFIESMGRSNVIVTFMLVYSVHAPLAKYLAPLIMGHIPGTLLHVLFGQNRNDIESVVDRDQRFVIFSRGLGDVGLGNPKAYLRTTARMLAKELRETETRDGRYQARMPRETWAGDKQPTGRMNALDSRRM